MKLLMRIFMFLFSPCVIVGTVNAAVVRLERGDIKDGTWMISKIVSSQTWNSTWYTTQALMDMVGKRVECFYPPQISEGVFATEYAVCRSTKSEFINSSTDTIRIPSLSESISLTSRQFATIEEKFPAYSYQEKDRDTGVVIKSTFSRTRVSGGDGRDLVVELFSQLGHSKSRDRVQVIEEHNTEHLNDFATDPGTDWIAEGQTWVHDSANGEMDIQYVGGAPMFRADVDEPGSIAHESQVTFLSGSGNNRGTGPSVRNFDEGSNHCYGLDVLGVVSAATTVSLIRSGSTVLASESPSAVTDGAHWWIMRIAAEGAVGENVALSVWYFDGGFSGTEGKPTDNGWLGDDGTPDFTYTDTAIDRHDETTSIQCGVSGRTPINSDYDTRTDNHKIRAISDRGGAAPAAPAPIRRRGWIRL